MEEQAVVAGSTVQLKAQVGLGLVILSPRVRPFYRARVLVGAGAAGREYYDYHYHITAGRPRQPYS